MTIRSLVHAARALIFAWMAVVLLGPIVLGLARRDSPTGSAGLGVATVAVGLASLVAAAWCARRSGSAHSTR